MSVTSKGVLGNAVTHETQKAGMLRSSTAPKPPDLDQFAMGHDEDRMMEPSQDMVETQGQTETEMETERC